MVDEIKSAIFSIGKDKAPGPDGYSSGFFKKAWNYVGDSFSDVVREFFESGALLKQVNHTAIALIPKSDHASSMQDFRPITYYNITYKVIAKVLSTRLAPIVVSLVNHV